MIAYFWRVFVGKAAKIGSKYVGKTAKIGLKHVGKTAKIGSKHIGKVAEIGSKHVGKVAKIGLKHVGKTEIYSYFCAVKMEIICLKERLTGIYKIFMPAHERHC